MSKTLTGTFGLVFGLIAGAVVGYLMNQSMGSTTTQRVLAGAIAGALAGMFGGTLGGDFGKRPDEGDANRNLFPAVAGGIMGGLAASQAHHLSEILSAVNLRSGL